MLDEKYERYWDDLDIDDDWRKILNDEYEDLKSDYNKFYKHIRSLDNMGEELLYKLSGTKYIQDDEIDGEQSDENEIIKGVSLKKLRSAVENLTEKQKLVLELYVFRGYKQKKIAEIMECSMPNVSMILSDALAKIRKNLNK